LKVFAASTSATDRMLISVQKLLMGTCALFRRRCRYLKNLKQRHPQTQTRFFYVLPIIKVEYLSVLFLLVLSLYKHILLTMNSTLFNTTTILTTQFQEYLENPLFLPFIFVFWSFMMTNHKYRQTLESFKNHSADEIFSLQKSLSQYMYKASLRGKGKRAPDAEMPSFLCCCCRRAATA
jgi:hypothetical protein